MGLEKSWTDGWLQNFQCTLTFGNEARRCSERQGQHRARRVSNGRAEDDGNVERGEDTLGDISNRRAVRNRRIALGEITEHDAAYIIEFASMLEMEQNAIHLIRLHATIFEDEERA